MSDGVAGAIVSLSVSNVDGVTSAADRISAKLSSVEQAGVAARRTAQQSEALAKQAGKALDDLDTKAEVSYQKLRRIESVLSRLAAKAAEELGDDEAAEKLRVTGSAIGTSLRNARIGAQVGGAIGSLIGPEGTAAGTVIGGVVAGVGTFVYEEVKGLSAVNDQMERVARQEAERVSKEREERSARRDEAEWRDQQTGIELRAIQQADIARLKAALGGGMP